jgi:hypothetical protein
VSPANTCKVAPDGHNSEAVRGHRTTFVLASFLALSGPNPALAGPVEQLVQLAIHPTDPKRMAVRYVWGGAGAFVTADGGKNWKLLCNSLVSNTVVNSEGPLVLTGDGSVLMGLSTGMWHDDGRACHWMNEPKYDGLFIGGFAVDPIDPAVTYSFTSSGGLTNGLLRRDASGTWSDLGKKENILGTRMLVVRRGSGRRFYLGLVKGEVLPPDGGPGQTSYAIRVSDDDGSTWTEHMYGVAGGKLQLQAVDPTNPDRLVISIERPGNTGTRAAIADSVLVSSDQGKTFEPYLTVLEVGGVAFAPDGRVWIGDGGNALDPTQPGAVYFAKSLDNPATKLPMSNYPVQCLAYQGATDTLYACQPTTFGSVNSADGSFTTSLDVRKVASFVDCPGVDMAAVCETQLCGAYCGFGHFAQAPLCCAYDTFSCGPAVAPSAVCPPKGTGGSGTTDGGKAGAMGRNGGGGMTNGADASVHPHGGGGADAGSAGAAGSGGPHSDSGCAFASPVALDAWWIEALGFAAAASLFRRRRSS